MVMKYMRYFYVGVIFSVSTIQPMEQGHNVYKQEFKALKKTRFHRTMLDRRSNVALRDILSRVENAKELNIFQRIIRIPSSFLKFNLENIWSRIFVSDMMIITPSNMPILYSYIAAVCRQQKIETPTIYISKNKRFFRTLSVKLLMSSGAMFIGQDLLRELSDKALEAAIAHEIGHIKHNHQNKMLFLGLATLTGTKIFLRNRHLRDHNLFVTVSINDNWPVRVNIKLANTIVSAIVLTLARSIIGKQFERQADEFVYKTTNNGEGLIEFCKHLQQKEQINDNDFDDTYASLKNSSSDVAFIDYIFLVLYYHLVHKTHKAYKWIRYKTLLMPHQSPEARINTAQKYLDEQAAKTESV